MLFLSRQSRVMLAIWGALFLAIIVLSLLGRWSLAFVALATLVLSLVPLALASRFSLTLPLPFLLGITLLIFSSIFMGEAFDFYERLWWWDLALHGASALGFGIFGFLFAFMLFEGDRFAAPPSAIALITFCFAVTVGVLWELFEFIMDFSFGLNMQKSGLRDTMGDLALDVAGAGLAAISGYLYLIRKQRGIFGRLVLQFIAANRRLYTKSRDRLRK